MGLKMMIHGPILCGAVPENDEWWKLCCNKQEQSPPRYQTPPKDIP